MSSVNSRAVAARIIARWLKSGDFPDRILDNVTADRAFVMEIVYGVVRRRRSLDWIIARCADRRPARDALPYLMVGLYQLLMMDNVAPHAAVNETVSALNKNTKYAASFVNAVLRRTTREREDILAALAKQPLAVRESHPDALVDRWTARFGAGRTALLCKWNNATPDVVIACNALRTDIQRLRNLFSEAGIEAVPHPAEPAACLRLPHGVRVTELPGFEEGLFTVQDPSTLTAVRLLDPRPGERVLDACAAPGGKAAAIAQSMQGCGTILAADLHADRLPRLRDNIERLGLNNVKIVQADAATAEGHAAAETEQFDRVLLDVPCTNTGVLRRRPDARWRFSAERLAALTELQMRMLENTAGRLAPGGTIVYSTCSLEPEEGEMLITNWLRQHTDFETIATSSLFPPETGTDGIYAAAMRRH